jgi:phage baseplate assembly protein W
MTTAKTTDYYEERAASGDFSKIIDKDVILVSIRNIITTPENSRLYLPGYGMDIHKYLFEMLDSQTADALAARMKEKITTWDSRVSIQSLTVSQDLLNKALMVDIVFRFNQETVQDRLVITSDFYEELQTDFEIPVGKLGI